MTVRAEIPNPARLLVDQQIVGVNVVSKKPERRLTISQSAVLLDQQGAYVLGVDDKDTVAILRVELGEQRGPRVIVNKGLSEGQRIIIAGHQKVRPGAKVAPSEGKTDADEASAQAAP